MRMGCIVIAALIPTRRKSSTRRVSRTRLLSASLGPKDIKMLMAESKQQPLGEVIFKRLLVTFIMFAILGVGIAVRFMVTIPSNEDYFGPTSNTTTLPDTVTTIIAV